MVDLVFMNHDDIDLEIVCPKCGGWIDVAKHSKAEDLAKEIRHLRLLNKLLIKDVADLRDRVHYTEMDLRRPRICGV